MAAKFTLKTARKVAGLSAQQVADALNLHVGTIYEYENFKSYPRVDTAREMANLYGIKFENIIFFQDKTG